MEMRVVNTIHLCLADNVLFNVMDENLTPVLWEKLEKLYMGNSFTNKLYLKGQLYGVKMAEGANML